jgi:hypothetical protein
MWETEPARAGFHVIGIPDTASRAVQYGVKNSLSP